MLQDARSEKIRSLLDSDVFCPLTTVYSVLKSAGAESLLSDPLMAVATMECPDDKSKTRYQLNERIRTKQKAIRKLSRKYSTSQLDQDDIEQMLYAIGDNSSFLAFHRDPIDKMISLLTAFFSPDEVRDGFSLSIVAQDNDDSSRLTHSHGRQFHYVRCLSFIKYHSEIFNSNTKSTGTSISTALERSHKSHVQIVVPGRERSHELEFETHTDRTRSESCSSLTFGHESNAKDLT